MNTTNDQNSILPIYAIRSFLKHEAAGGICLMLAAALAMVVANSGLYEWYDKLLNIYFQIGFESKEGVPFDAFAIQKPVVLWINDGLMAIFFMLVGLEIKREILMGELSSFQRAVLPGVAAIGGMAIPALVFLAVNMDYPENHAGWAIPAATDIAFALGILALLGSRAPTALKVFLTAVAIIDDLGAIIIIALFYTQDLTILALILGAAGCFVLFLLNRFGVKTIAPYIITGIFMWICVLKSGIHATLAGVLIAVFIPMKGIKGREDSPVMKLEKMLHPWVAFMVLPIFGFANAGVSFAEIQMYHIVHPLTIGIAAGLVFGKQIGIMLAVFLCKIFKIADKPKSISWVQMYGVATLCGIGFTMSLFIGKLGFDSLDAINEIRIGVIGGSLVSALIGYGVLYYAGKDQTRYQHDSSEIDSESNS